MGGKCRRYCSSLTAQNIQDRIMADAERGNRLEKKLALHLGGYQQRAKKLRQHVGEAGRGAGEGDDGAGNVQDAAAGRGGGAAAAPGRAERRGRVRLAARARGAGSLPRATGRAG